MPSSPRTEQVAPGVVRLRIAFVNVYFVSDAETGAWVLVDTGLPFSSSTIRAAARAHFGERAPAAIVLTHGYFDHVGTVRKLADAWAAPVYAHAEELPYLTGRAHYAPPDPSVAGGMARLSCLYPHRAIDLGDRVTALPADGSVPDLPGWTWLLTPGHTPGHVSFFRESDRTLIAGDAFVTVRQESAAAVLAQAQEVHGPPAYFTPDWQAARRSVERLADLRPSVAATGHGVPMRGPALQQGLARLVDAFDARAVPAHGHYVRHPAHDARDATAPTPSPCQRLLLAAAVGAGVAFVLRRRAAS